MNGYQSQSIPASLQMLLRDLEFLGQITRGQKPCIKTRTFVDASGWSGAFYRFIKGETKGAVMSEIERIFTQCIEAIGAHKNDEHIKTIVEYAYRAYVGVKSLEVTYRDHPSILSRLSVALKNLDLQLDSYRHLIKGYVVTEFPYIPVEKKEEIKETQKVKEYKPEEKTNLDLNDSMAGMPAYQRRKLLKTKLKESLEKND